LFFIFICFFGLAALEAHNSLSQSGDQTELQ